MIVHHRNAAVGIIHHQNSKHFKLRVYFLKKNISDISEG